MRALQGIQIGDHINSCLLAAIKSNQPLYRDTGQPSRLLTPTKYLDKKIAVDGPWGVMLVQTSQEAGYELVKGQCPDEMTGNGLQHLELADQSIDAMGVFEWIALTMQKDPKLSPQNDSWLLANRIEVGNDPYVPRGDWYGGQVRSYLSWVDHLSNVARVRLAVM